MEDFAVGRKGVLDSPSPVFFVHESCLGESPRVFRYRLHIAVQVFGNFLERNVVLFCDQK